MAQKLSDIALQVVNIWNELPRGAHGLPLHDHLDPAALPQAALPHVFVADMAAEPVFEVVIRQQGRYIVEQIGQDLAGRRIDAASCGPSYGSVLSTYRVIASSKRPTVTIEQLTAQTGTTIDVEVVHLPFAAADGRVAGVLGTIVRTDPGAFVADFKPIHWMLLDCFNIESRAS